MLENLKGLYPWLIVPSNIAFKTNWKTSGLPDYSRLNDKFSDHKGGGFVWRGGK